MDKKSISKINPPGVFKKLLHWFCDRNLLEELEGDLEETFYTNLNNRSHLYAKYKYAKEVLFLMRPSVMKHFRFLNNFSNIMFNNYGKVAFRNFSKNKTFVLINILSMSIGLACCIVSYLNYKHNNSFDEYHKNADELYRINYQQQDGSRLRQYGVAPVSLFEESKKISPVSEAVRYNEWHRSVQIEDQYFDLNVGHVSENFLDVFTFPLKYGNKNSLQEKSAIIISQQTAIKLFGRLDVLGQVLTYVQGGIEKSFTVEGVLEKIPSNSSFQFDALTHRDNLINANDSNQWFALTTLFLVIKDKQAIASVENSINEFITKTTPPNSDEPVRKFHLDPLIGMASRAEANSVIGPLEVSLPKAMEIVPGVISLLILLIACFTFTNTSITSSASRLKEIGIRKVMGGSKSQVIFQFLSESIIICLLALIAAYPLSNFIAAQYNQLMPFLDIELTIANNLAFFSFLAFLVLLSGLIAGSYPAIFLSKFQPTKILKGNLKYRSVGRLTKILLTGQFAFAMLTITASVLFIQNAQFQNTIDLGFDTNETIVIRFGDKKEAYPLLLNALATNPKVTATAASVDHVGRRYHNATVSDNGELFDIVGLDVGPNYIETVELQLLQGRDFNTERESDFIENVIVNEQFVKSRGWENAIGKKLVFQDSINYYVIGVVKDFYFDAFNSPIQPLWLRLKKEDKYNYFIAKTSSRNAEVVMAEISTVWKELFNEEIDDIKPPEYPKNEAQTINTIILKVFIFMGSIAAIMSMIGFFSLVSLNLVNRMKEIGIRKVSGSSTIGIINIINRDYILVLIGGVTTGSIASYFLVPIFMGSIWAYHIEAGLGIVLLSILLMSITSMVTVGVRVFKAANTNPIYLLRDE